MRKIAIALGAMAFAFGALTSPVDAATKAKPKTAKVLVKKSPKVAKYKSRCKAGTKWNATATMGAGACEKRKVVKVKVRTKKAEKPADKPAVIKKVG